MRMDRGADDSVDAIVRGWLYRKLATPRPQKRRELFWNSSDCRHLISQPILERLGVGNARLAEVQQLPDFRSMTLPGSAGGIVSVIAVGLDAKLSSHALDSPGADFRWLRGSPLRAAAEANQRSNCACATACWGGDFRA
jgi:hypothetical protein